MFAFKKSGTLLAHTFSFLGVTDSPRSVGMKSVCGHSAWGLLVG